jgi:hypothetical protein
MFSWLSMIPFAISMISNSSNERSGSRMVDNPENRKWWMNEFDLGLHDVTLAQNDEDAF